jgi:hypothetical protein
MGPPFELILLAPASVVAALTTRRRGIRAVLGLLAATYCTALGLSMIPMETSDSFGGYRIFGGIAYAGVGVLWAAFGVTLLVTERGGRRGSSPDPRFRR